MNGTYPVSVYQWNHYDGEEPEVNSIGLPPELAYANLPTSVPDHSDVTSHDVHENEQLSYSPGLMEMPMPHEKATPVVPVAPPANEKQPGLWKAVGNAVFGGTSKVSKTNSTAAVASGQNPKLGTGA